MNNYLQLTDKFHITYSGAEIDYKYPNKIDFSLEDIAWGLSHICRFAGQVKRFYSVAEHTVLMGRYLEERQKKENKFPSYTDDAMLYILLHDASEAYMNDLPRNLKRLCPGYIIIEEKMTDAIFNTFLPGFNWREVEERWKWLDIAMSRNESNQLRDAGPYNESAVSIKLLYAKPERIYEEFLEMLKQYIT